MQKKLTITLDERVYEGLHSVVGRRRISRFIQELVRPHVLEADLADAYRLIARRQLHSCISDNYMSASGYL